MGLLQLGSRFLRDKNKERKEKKKNRRNNNNSRNDEAESSQNVAAAAAAVPATALDTSSSTSPVAAAHAMSPSSGPLHKSAVVPGGKEGSLTPSQRASSTMENGDSKLEATGRSRAGAGDEDCDASSSASSMGTRNTKGTRCSSRHDSIVEWKSKLHETGDLAQTVVHIETSEMKRVEDVYAGVRDGPVLGKGAAGIVRKCTHRETGVEFAVKCLDIGLIESDEIIERLREEIFVMCQSDHPDIIRLEEVYESDTQIYLVVDLLTGGDMFDRLEEQPDYHYGEAQCAKVVKQMMNAIRYLHSKNVVHRDLKLENFLFDDPDSGNIRLIDFGLSKHFDHDGYKFQEVTGTPYVAAPEMFEGEYDEKVDVWSIGVITYLLLCGDPPFGGMDGEAPQTIKDNVMRGDLPFEPKDIWDNVSEEAKNFVKRLLTLDPTKRPSAEEAQHDEWLNACSKQSSEQGRTSLSPRLVNNLLDFRDYSNLHKILLEVISFTLVPEQIKGLKEAFEEIDRDGRGEITLEDLKEVLLNRADTGELGSITEEEVETIFDSLRLHKSETTIRWHEFIAAGLSRADIDNRNLRLAFNRFDTGGKGYITLTDLNDLLGTSDGTMDTEIKKMWQDGMKECKCKDKLSFEDFQQFLEAQSPADSLYYKLTQ